MRRHARVLGVFAGLALIALGCSGSARQEVTGTVTFKGEPVPDGIIEFIPQDGQATKGGAQIVAGKFTIPRGDHGLLPGHYKVSIIAGDGTSGAGNADPDAGAGRGRRPKVVPGGEMIPPEWNAKSTVVREITSGGPNHFEFNIP